MDSPSISLVARVLPKINYATRQNGVAIVSSFQLENKTPNALENVDLEIVSQPKFCVDYVLRLDRIEANETRSLSFANLKFDDVFWAELSSNLFGRLTFRLTKDGETLAETSEETEILLCDEESGIRSIPPQMRTEDGWRVEIEEREPDELTAASRTSRRVDVERRSFETPVETRADYWARRLLDLSLNNPLLNARLRKNSKTAIPLLVDRLDDWENALAADGEFSLGPKPDAWTSPKDPTQFLESKLELEPVAELLACERKNRRVRTSLDEDDLEKTARELFRRAKNSLDENGANSLYVALGFLRWTEKPNAAPRYAPIVLVPVELKRIKGRKGFSIATNADETRVNTTLLEALRERFQIDVGGLGSLSTDDSGVDLQSVFAVFRQAILEQKGWDVVENAVLGLFSFTQFVMWNDLRQNLEKLRENQLVASLLDNRLTWKPEPIEVENAANEDENAANEDENAANEDEFDDLERDVFAPIPADATQLIAIKAASEGKTFVLHGPPGTGKSQTIVNTIANALAQNKRVLFVAEKAAALDAVRSRLERIGLAPYCLELHSNKATKRSVLSQLERAIQANGARRPRDFDRKTEELETRRKTAAQYVRALWRRRSDGTTLYEMISRYEKSRAAERLPNFPDAEIVAGSPETSRRRLELVERTAAFLASIAPLLDSPFRPIRLREYSQRFRSNAPEIIDALRRRVEPTRQAAELLRETYSLDAVRAGLEYEKLERFCTAFLTLGEIPKIWLEAPDFEKFLDRLETFVDLGRDERRLAARLLERWTGEILEFNFEKANEEYVVANAKPFFLKFLARRRFFRKLAEFCKPNGGPKKPTDADWKDAKETLALYRRTREKREEASIAFGAKLAKFETDDRYDWNELERLARLARGAFVELKTQYETKIDAIVKTLAQTSLPKTPIANYLDARADFRKARDVLFETFAVDEKTFETVCGDDYLAGLQTLCETWRDDPDGTRDWIRWQALAEELRREGLESVVAALESGWAPTSLVASFEKSSARASILQTFDEEPTLNDFDATSFEAQIADYKTRAREYATLTAREILGRLAANVPNLTRSAAESSEPGVLLKAIKNGGRGKSLRNLFGEIPNLLSRLCPCMLTSPISVAQYLAPDAAPFDLVIFDEASQLPTYKAVGALARGKSAVVVGDPKQLPPTTFFATSGASNEDEDVETVDLESVLDDCLALSTPDAKLRWHYRSRSESLVAFSNERYYNGELYTFPAIDDRVSKVRYVPVDGFYDRGGSRVNQAEAEAIVAEILRRARDSKLRESSVGVVAFSVPQQNLIDDLLTDALANEPELEVVLRDVDEPIFVKNLENAQGDERDVILFSIGYGPDKDGRVSMNFGPLNKAGGARRLNVAITRARCETIVFATLRPEQIVAARTASEGVADLKAFLEYAQGALAPLGALKKSENDDEERDGILRSIADRLRTLGYKTQFRVGRSGFRVDLGVFDPNDDEKYLLGVLLDGEYYRDAKTVREREYAQIDVLKGLGWNLIRVWSVEWWENPDKVLRRIENELDALLQKKRAARQASEALVEETPSEPSAEDSFEALVEESPSEPPAEESSEALVEETSSEPSAEESSEALAEETPSEPSEPPAEVSSEALAEETPSEPSAEDSSEALVEETPSEPSAEDSSEGLVEETPSEPSAEESFEALAEETVAPSIPIETTPEKETSEISETFVDEALRRDESLVEFDAQENAETARRFYVATPPTQDGNGASEPFDEARLTERIREIVETESPIAFELLAKRLRESRGVSRGGSRSEEPIRRILNAQRFCKTSFSGVDFYWAQGANPKDCATYRVPENEAGRRDVDAIAPEEIAVAVRETLREQLALDADDLTKEVYRLFGFVRKTEKIERWIEAGVDLACERGWAKRDGIRVAIG